MFILDSLLIDGLRFVLDKVVQTAEAEAQDDSALRDQLLEAQMRFELGEISDEQFREIERDVLAAIREIKRPQQGAKADSDGPKRFAPYLRLYIAGNPLAEASKAKQLEALKAAGVRIEG